MHGAYINKAPSQQSRKGIQTVVYQQQERLYSKSSERLLHPSRPFERAFVEVDASRIGARQVAGTRFISHPPLLIAFWEHVADQYLDILCEDKGSVYSVMVAGS